MDRGESHRLTKARVELRSATGLIGVVSLSVETGLQGDSHCQPKGT